MHQTRNPLPDTPTGRPNTAAYHRSYVWAISMIAALGGLLFGYDWVVIGGAAPFYEAYLGLTDSARIGWAMSSALVGCLIGSVVSGLLSDRFGRKRLLLVAAVLFGGSSILTGMAMSFAAFVIWRIAGGVAIGMASNLSPVYIAEVSPAQWRGRLVSVNQLNIVIGILCAQVVNWLIAQPVASGATLQQIAASWNGMWGWRFMFMAVAVPSTLFFTLSLFVPESPRWLAKKGRDSHARRVLTRLFGAEEADVEMAQIKETLHQEDIAHVRFADLWQPSVRRMLAVGATLAVICQWSGINVIFNYAKQVFGDAGYNISDMLFNVVITGTVNLVFTVLAMRVVDHWGRRNLFLLGCGGLALLHSTIGLGYYCHFPPVVMLLAVLAAIACYAYTLAPVTWVLISELFPNRIRGAAVAVAVSALWLGCFSLTFTFPILNRQLGAAGTFWLYAAICAAGFWFVWAWVPETKGRTLEEIESVMG